MQKVWSVVEKIMNGTELAPLGFVMVNLLCEESQSDMRLSRLDNLDSLPTH